MAITYIVFNSIALLVSVMYLCKVSHLVAWCSYDREEVNRLAREVGVPPSFCNYAYAGFAFAIICCIFRVVGIVLANGVSFYKPKEWDVPQTQQIVDAEIPTANVIVKKKQKP